MLILSSKQNKCDKIAVSIIMSQSDLLFPTPHPVRSDAVKNRALILHTAQQLFQQQGVEAVSMSAIADAADIGKGTLYRHFQSKIELCLALLDDDQREFQERTILRLRQPGDPLETLDWFLREALAFVERNSPMLCAGAVAGGVNTLQQPAHWWWRQTIRGLLGKIDVRGDRDYIVDSLYVLLDVHTVYFFEQVRGYSPEHVADNLCQVAHSLTSS
jgi:AcrR family transcriptional regulator